MTDYEKLKAFAEELNPNFCEIGERNNFTHNGERVLYKGKYGYLTVDSSNSKVNSPCDSDEVNIDNLDKWIDETREYWREQGLPSLQKPKGKLYEIPDTVVHLETQEEYDEYMQMCEDVGWNWASGCKPTDWNHWVYNKNVVICSPLKGGFMEKKIISLKELRKKIGLEKKYFNITYKYFEQSDINENYKQKEINKTNKKSIMKNIKDTLKALTHSKEDKALIKAELKTEDNTWTSESYQYALSELVNERLDTKEFKEQMLKVAEERNKECK